MSHEPTPSAQYGDPVSWQEYVKRHARGRSQVALAADVGVSQAAVSRWIKGTQGVDAEVAVRFARAVGDEPLAALVAAGFLTEGEAKVRPAATPDYSKLTNEELLALVRERMRDEGGGEGDAGAPANQSPAPGPADQPGRQVTEASGAEGIARGRGNRRRPPAG